MKKATRNQPSAGGMNPVQRAESRVAFPAELKEILGFPANLLIKLPIPTCLTIRIPGVDGEFIWSTASREALSDSSAEPVFDRSEVAALIVAAESERAWDTDLAAWVAAKRDDPGFRIDLETALGRTAPVADQDWSVGRVLRWYGCELREVEIAPPSKERDHGFDAAA
jgi:hypothetical protein